MLLRAAKVQTINPKKGPLVHVLWSLIGPIRHVVTREVPDFAFIYGVPARQQGWVSKAGARLNFDSGTTAICDTTGEKYELRDGVVAAISQ